MALLSFLEHKRFSAFPTTRGSAIRKANNAGVFKNLWSNWENKAHKAMETTQQPSAEYCGEAHGCCGSMGEADPWAQSLR